MECSNWLNIIGLSLNIIGFILILIYGLPTKFVDTRYRPANPENIFAEPNIEREIYQGFVHKHNGRIKHIGWIGIILNIIGLSLQVLANCL